MESPEYLVVEEASSDFFIQKLNEAAEEGFKVISSNQFIIRHEDSGFSQSYEISYYALMEKSQKYSENDFQYKILDELNEIKFELIEVVKNLKYLGE